MFRSGGLRALLVGAPVLVGVVVIGRYDHLIFHSLTEFFSIIIACGIFMMAWNSRRYLDNNSLLFIGIAYLSVGALDLIHTLAYISTNASLSHETNLPMQLWVAARLVQGASLLLAPLFVKRSLNAHGLLFMYVLVTVLLLISIFYRNVFPDCYVEGEGATPFKTVSEYLVSVMFVGSIFAFSRYRGYLDRHVFRQIVLSLVFSVASDLAFTFSVRVDDAIFIIGHVLKVIAFYFIYDAIIVTGLTRPYDTLMRNLKQSEESLNITVRQLSRARSELESRVRERTAELLMQTESLEREMEERKKMEEALRESETKYRIVAENTRSWEWWLAPDGRFVYVSPSCSRITGHDVEEFIENKELIYQITHPEDRQKLIDHVCEVDEKQEGGEVEFRIVRPDGSCRHLAHACLPVFDAHGVFLGHRGSNRDITEKRVAEDALRESEQALRFLSSQLLTVQENERKRVARELHDGINQTLSAIKVGLETKLAGMRDNTPGGISLERIIDLVGSGIEEARRIQMDLRPPMLDDLGIVATLQWFTREFGEVYSHLRIELKADVKEDHVPDAIKVVIFRIVQESFNNISKHSRAKSVHVSLKEVRARIELMIEDDGVGFDIDHTSKGLGLTSMRERTELSMGEFEVRSVPGQGTAIVASWPVTEQVMEERKDPGATSSPA